jgi:hypothetical protein
MMTVLKRKKDDLPFPDDVARMKALLNAQGYDASDEDLDWAYRKHSRKHYFVNWAVTTGVPDGELFDNLMEWLEPDSTAKG